MTRRIPILASLVVLAAVAVMIALGFWQLRRLHEKEALLATYAETKGAPGEIAWTGGGPGEHFLYRRAHLECVEVTSHSSMAGRNAKGDSGMAQTAQCTLPDGGSAKVVLGWAMTPDAGKDWQGGTVRGVVAPGPRLVADPPLGGLEANAIPDPSEIPNNHFSYAMQWFFFATTALAVYAIAVCKRFTSG